MIRRPPRSTLDRSSAASDVYKRQNELCNALRPVVLPGETIRVFVLKEGKEAGQGVAYLDDGTMIVVDNARRCIGRNVDVTVTSVLQTTAGRMIFTRLKEESEREEYQVARG